MSTRCCCFLLQLGNSAIEQIAAVPGAHMVGGQTENGALAIERIE